MNLLRLQLGLKGREIQNLTFRKDEVLIGRNPKADVQLDNPSVSWEHARIRRESGLSWVLADLGSSNGTFLNHRPVTRAFVRDEDVVTIGKFTLVVGFKDDERKPERRFSDQVTDVHVQPVDQTFALSEGQIRQFLEESEPPSAPEPSATAHEPSAPAEKPFREAIETILEHRWGPAGIAAVIGFLLGVLFTTCVG